VYVKGLIQPNGDIKKTMVLGMAVPDKEELPKQAFLSSIPGHELTSKWYVIVLSTTCSNEMV